MPHWKSMNITFRIIFSK